jgi:hypothetical protein
MASLSLDLERLAQDLADFRFSQADTKAGCLGRIESHAFERGARLKRVHAGYFACARR